MGFDEFKISNQLFNAIEDLGYQQPTPIQEAVFSIIRSGRDVVGIAQTGTGKTLAYMLPLLSELKYGKHANPRILILVPTRELVVQLVEQVEKFTQYMSVEVLGLYGGVNINTQKQQNMQSDIIVATPGRLYDLVLCKALQLKTVKKLVIDEVDIMLDMGFRFQLNNILELLPERRQNMLFSATMIEEVDQLIDGFFNAPERISIAVSGTPLDNIEQTAYAVPNFYTKVNLLSHLLKDQEAFSKVLVFASSKRNVDRIFEAIESQYGDETCVIHANKSQNYRLRSIDQFNSGTNRVLLTTDIMARGLDLSKITHVINMDVPIYPENYMHRIGRTGRAKEKGKSVLLYTEDEEPAKQAIETLMRMKIPLTLLPEEIEVATQLIPEERPEVVVKHNRKTKTVPSGASFHEKSEKNKKVNLGGSYRRTIAKKYSKPKTKGDKNYNKRNKRK